MKGFTSDQVQKFRQVKNIEKELRLADACTDEHEKDVHYQRAIKLAERYGIPTDHVL